MTASVSEDWAAVEPVLGGIALVVAGIVSASAFAIGVHIQVAGQTFLSIVAAIAAVGLTVLGLYTATAGHYRAGVGALTGAAGFTLVFLAPLARSTVAFAAVGGLFVVLSGLFLIATGFGYAVVVDDTGEK